MKLPRNREKNSWPANFQRGKPVMRQARGNAVCRNETQFNACAARAHGRSDVRAMNYAAAEQDDVARLHRGFPKFFRSVHRADGLVEKSVWRQYIVNGYGDKF